MSKKLQLNFAGSEKVDPRVEFTRASTATYTNGGLLKIAAVNQPRITYDPLTGKCLGLLIEEARTNLLIYSEQFDNAAWAQNAVADTDVTPNAAIAPDGTLTADKLYEATTTSSTHSVYQDKTSPPSTVHSVSLYAKAGERQYFSIRFHNTVTLSSYCSGAFDLVGGTCSVNNYGNATGATATITHVGNGWYRCTLSGTPDTSGTSVRVSIGLSQTLGGTWLYSGTVGSGIYIWGAQVEAGAFPTSYIPTTSAAATRAADNASMSGANFSSWYRQDEGTLLADFSTLFDTAATRAVVIGTSTDYIGLLTSSGSNGPYAVIVLGNVGQANLPTSGVTATANTRYKLCIGYALNNSVGSLNGNTPVVDSSCSIPTVSVMYIGQDASGGNQMNGIISRITYYPNRLTDTQIKALSAV